jgi:hypothetical protein
VLFGQVKISKATFKTEKHCTADYNNPAPAFAKHVNVEDLRKLEDRFENCWHLCLFAGPFSIQ